MSCVMTRIWVAVLALQPTAAAARRVAPMAGARGRAVRMSLAAADQRFIGWVSERSASSLSKVELATFPPGLRGLRATRPLTARDESIMWPASLALEVTTGMRAPENVSKPLWTESQWYTRLALLLLAQKARGSDSKLAEWLEALPQAFDTPYSWSDTELAALHYPALEGAVRAQRDEWAAIHAAMSASGLPYSKPQVEWALHCVRSRAFSGAYEGSTYQQRIGLVSFIAFLTVIYPLIGAGSWSEALTGAVAGLIFVVTRDVVSPRVLDLRRYVLCPLIDMLNHDGTVQSDVQYRVFTNTFCVTADREFAPGEEVRISYGPRSNDQLLQFHGFVERGNVHDAYFMADFLAHVDSFAGVSDSALDTLEKQGLLTLLRRGIRLDCNGQCDEPSTRLTEQLCAALGGSQRPADLVLAACTLEQQRLPTSLEEDTAELAQLAARRKASKSGAPRSSKGFDPTAADERQRTILEFRVAKKAMLRKAVEAAQAYARFS